MLNRMQERKAFRDAIARAKNAAFIARVREIAQELEHRNVDRRAALAAELDDATTLFSETSSWPEQSPRSMPAPTALRA